MIEKILVPLDGSGFGEDTIPLATSIARQACCDVDVTHVHVPHPPDHLLSNTQYQFEGVDLDEYDRWDRDQEREYLASVARRIEEESGRKARPVLLTGLVADAIDHHARESGQGLIVMSTHGRTGLSRAWLGSVADALIRHAPWPVLLVRPGDQKDEAPRYETDFGRILVPLDGSKPSERVLDPVLDLAEPMGATVVLLRVVAPHTVLGTRVMPVSEALLEEVKARAAEYLDGVEERLRSRGVEVESVVVDDPQPALAILEVAEREDVDLVALATHGYGGMRRAVIGSVADKVLRGVEVPLLLLGPGVGEEA